MMTAYGGQKMSILRKLFSAMLVVMTAASCVKAKTVPSDTLHVYFFDAGKADAILLYTAESAVLIDTGETGFGTKIRSYMNSYGIDHLDALIITHFDKDHVGGAAEILGTYPVDTVYISDSPKDSDEYKAFTAALEKAGMSAVTVTDEESVLLNLDDVRYEIDGPDVRDYDADDSNNSSLITSVTYGTSSFLFTGDAEEERLEEYLADHDAQYDVLKVPHHGNWQKALKALVEITDPEIAVITCSKNEGGEEKTLNLLSKNGIRTFLTYEGPVLITSDGETLTAEY